MNEALERPAAVEPAAPASAPARIGVLLVNLGTPEAPAAPAVRRYLREFLSDPRVIENQGLAWKLILNGIILPFRPRRKAPDYLKIWNRQKNESPLKTITRSQAEKLAAMLPQAPTVVDWAMRYGQPSIAATVINLVARGCERMLIVPLYPQYCAATTATACDEVFRVLARMRRQPPISRRSHPRPAPSCRGWILRRMSCSPHFMGCRRTTSIKAIHITPIASRPYGCCAQASASTNRS
jgi:hypothetical protein